MRKKAKQYFFPVDDVISNCYTTASSFFIFLWYAQLSVVPPFFIRPGYSTNGKLATVSLSTKALGQEPFAFQIGIGRIIKGLEEGVLRMATGEMAKIHCCMLYLWRPMVTDGTPHAETPRVFSNSEIRD
jgi:hypothetical protein